MSGTREQGAHEQVLRGIHADQELRETSLAFDAVEAGIMRQLLNTSPGAPEKVLRLHAAAWGLYAAREALQRTISNGKHAEHTLAAETAIAEAGLTRP